MKKALVFVGILALGLAMALPALASTAPTAGTCQIFVQSCVTAPSAPVVAYFPTTIPDTAAPIR